MIYADSPLWYLNDDQGRPSALRLYGLIAVLGGVLLAFQAVYVDSWMGCTLAGWIVAVAFGGKVWQKRIENVSRGTSAT